MWRIVLTNQSCGVIVQSLFQCLGDTSSSGISWEIASYDTFDLVRNLYTTKGQATKSTKAKKKPKNTSGARR